MVRKPGEQPTNPLNIMRFVVKRPQSVRIIGRKIWKRLSGRHEYYSLSEISVWIGERTTNAAAIAERLDSNLWQEARKFGDNLRYRAETILKKVPFDMGAGADYEFLYWLTRYLKPEYVVETGVSAGWSSEAFLSAMSTNCRGTLYSSDFPYFRVKNPE